MGKCARKYRVFHPPTAPHWCEVKISFHEKTFEWLGWPRAAPLAVSLGGFASWPDYRSEGPFAAVLTFPGGKETDCVLQHLKTKYTCPLGSSWENWHHSQWEILAQSKVILFSFPFKMMWNVNPPVEHVYTREQWHFLFNLRRVEMPVLRG